MFLNPFWPFTAAKVLALKATVLLLLTMLIKAKIRITAFSALGLFLLLLQTLWCSWPSVPARSTPPSSAARRRPEQPP